jgi:hypothetical protein
MIPSHRLDSSNPYAAPQYPGAQARPGERGMVGGALRPVGSGGPWIRWVLLASYVCGIPLFLVGRNMLQPYGDRELAPLGVALTVASALCCVTYAVLIFVWIGISWSMIPPAGRRTRSEKEISPAQAIGFLFIPFYNCYWVFAQSMGLCDALNRQLAAFSSVKRAPRGVAVAASIVQMIPFLNLAFGPLVWLPYIFLLDAAKAAYRRAGFAARPLRNSP